jgi:hypothetical protein
MNKKLFAVIRRGILMIKFNKKFMALLLAGFSVLMFELDANAQSRLRSAGGVRRSAGARGAIVGGAVRRTNAAGPAVPAAARANTAAPSRASSSGGSDEDNAQDIADEAKNKTYDDITCLDKFTQCMDEICVAENDPEKRGRAKCSEDKEKAEMTYFKWKQDKDPTAMFTGNIFDMGSTSSSSSSSSSLVINDFVRGVNICKGILKSCKNPPADMDDMVALKNHRIVEAYQSLVEDDVRAMEARFERMLMAERYKDKEMEKEDERLAEQRKWELEYEDKKYDRELDRESASFDRQMAMAQMNRDTQTTLYSMQADSAARSREHEIGMQQNLLNMEQNRLDQQMGIAGMQIGLEQERMNLNHAMGVYSMDVQQQIAAQQAASEQQMMQWQIQQQNQQWQQQNQQQQAAQQNYETCRQQCASILTGGCCGRQRRYQACMAQCGSPPGY